MTSVLDPLLSLSATSLSAKMAAGEVTAEALMQATLDRVSDVNPKLNAIVALQPPEVLMAQARAADQAERRGWLHGLPVAIKDLVMTEGIRTTFGSPLFADLVPPKDDGLAARLRAAGAIVIGKTNVPQFGLGSHSTNPVYGVTRNPFDLSRTAGGSSGGAGSALAAGLLSVADGSDMMGSLRNPAGWNNVYSLRPTWGVVPAEPLGDTYLHTLATDGPMARDPLDLAPLLQTLASIDPRRPYGRAVPDLTVEAPRRIGWLADWGGAYPMEDGILALCEAALATFDVEIVPLPAPFDPAELWSSWTMLRSFAIAAKHGAFYHNPDHRKHLNAQAQWEIAKGLDLTAIEVHRASEQRSRWLARTAELFTEVEALALPTAQVWPFPADWNWPENIAGTAMDTYHRWMEVVVPVSLIGLPAVTIPAGFGAQGLPMGLQIFGPPDSDGSLLSLACAQHRKHGRPAGPLAL